MLRLREALLHLPVLRMPGQGGVNRGQANTDQTQATPEA
jgi:hypothetical protein